MDWIRVVLSLLGATLLLVTGLRVLVGHVGYGRHPARTRASRAGGVINVAMGVGLVLLGLGQLLSGGAAVLVSAGGLLVLVGSFAGLLAWVFQHGLASP